MNRIRHLRLVALVVAGLFAAACSAGATSTPAATASPGASATPPTKTLTVGAALPLTGATAAAGKEQRDGYDLWKDAVNAKGGIKVGGTNYLVDIKYYDYQSDTTTAVNLTQKLITEDKVVAVLGPYGSGATEAASAVAEQYKVPMLSPTAATVSLYQKGYKYLFGTLPDAALLSKQSVDLFMSLSPAPKTIGLIGLNAVFQNATANLIVGFAKTAGLQVVYNQQFPSGTTDLSTALLGAKAANPDILVGLGFVNDMILMTKQAKELDVKPKVFLQSTGVTDTSYLPALKGDANGVLSPELWWPSLKYTDGGKLFGSASDYAASFQKKYGYAPSYVAASASVCGYLIQLAVESAQSTDPTAIRDALAKMDVDTFYGHLKFNPGGQTITTVPLLVQVIDQKYVMVFPESVATAKAQYPRP